MKQEFYTKETIKQAFESLTENQREHLRTCTCLIEDREVTSEKVLQNLIAYISDISKVANTGNPYHDLLNVVF